ncbi:MAG TPA: response regulator transcription factor [Chloroflexota bacterium]|nr:response regulator transcription factor [Chloroflexota bacterium]
MPALPVADRLERTRPDRPIVLVVEDDTVIADVIAEMLDGSGYVVERAATAAEARRKIGQSRLALVVLDLILPDLDGLMLCSDIRRGTDVPIIVVSGTHRKGDAVLSLRLGADDFVPKPFDVAELEARIQTVLRRGA